MDKFEKKIRKIIKNPENALVIGSGFDHLTSILSAHNTAFVIESKNQDIKAKNIIYKENFDYMNLLYDVRVIYFDLDKLHYLEKLQDFWRQQKSLVIIEGGEPIGRKHSKPLYDSGWGCTSVEKRFHVWEKIR